jgi:pimeloyl-ACP methyl ester carboxylesterase
MEYGIHEAGETGIFDGFAYQLWLPNIEGPSPAVAVLHGAGSRKENHADFARVAAGHGFVALTFDNRGHGDTDGDLGPRTVTDIGRLVRFLAERPEVDERLVALRGSSMGGLYAIHVAAVTPQVAGVIAICPASERMFLEDVRNVADGEPPRPDSALASVRIDARGLAAWLEEQDVRHAVALLGAKPLMLVHARDDEVVPYQFSDELYEHAEDPKRLLLLAGGDHRSAQHDTEVQGESLRWVALKMRQALSKS